ncbi:hypothetical protein BJ165DRAFT_1533644 [Panaeolus papilionaceus]|nr:hypothetical protein BJ165DRAFT_1533644 [Panaeolus papilionaceus]
MLFTAASILAVATAASAQQVIKVGATANDQGGIFQFIPPTVTAKNGTVVTFEFTGAPGNHSITQSTFTDPCNPVSGGFDSGWVFIPNAAALTETPTFNLTITDDSKPIWFYCKQLLPSPHCSVGMVGGINVPTNGSNTFAAFQTNAKNFKGNSGQGQNGLVGIGASASAGVGPVPASVQLFGGSATQTGSAGASGTASGGSAGSTPTSPSGSGSGSPSPTPGSALSVAGNTVYVAIAAALGIALA